MTVMREGRRVRIRVTSKGTGLSTEVVDAETGGLIEGVTAVEWSCRVGELAEAKITVVGVEVDVESDRVMLVAPALRGPADSTTLGDEWRTVAAPG